MTFTPVPPPEDMFKSFRAAEESKCAVADLINVVGKLDTQLGYRIVNLSTFEKGRDLTKGELGSTKRRIAARIKLWRRLTIKIAGEGSPIARDAELIARAIERLASVRHDLAHGDLEYSDSLFGALVQCRVQKPLGYMFVHLDNADENTGFLEMGFELIYKTYFLKELVSQGETLLQFMNDVYWRTHHFEESERQGNPQPAC